MPGIFDHILERFSKRNWDSSANALAQEIQLAFRGIGLDGFDGPLIINQQGNNPAIVIRTSTDSPGPSIGIETPDGHLPDVIVGGTVTGGFTGGDYTFTPGGVVFGGTTNGGISVSAPTDIGPITIGLGGGPDGDGYPDSTNQFGDTTTVGGGGGSGLVGRVQSGGGGTYTVAVYDAEGVPADRTAAPLNVPDSETVPPGTWVSVFLFGTAYKFLASVWLDEVTP